MPTVAAVLGQPKVNRGGGIRTHMAVANRTLPKRLCMPIPPRPGCGEPDSSRLPPSDLYLGKPLPSLKLLEVLKGAKKTRKKPKR